MAIRNEFVILVECVLVARMVAVQLLVVQAEVTLVVAEVVVVVQVEPVQILMDQRLRIVIHLVVGVIDNGPRRWFQRDESGWDKEAAGISLYSLHYIPTSLAGNAVASSASSFLLLHTDVTCNATQLSVSFFIETFIHAKEKVSFIYYHIINKFYQKKIPFALNC